MMLTLSATVDLVGMGVRIVVLGRMIKVASVQIDLHWTRPCVVTVVVKGSQFE